MIFVEGDVPKVASQAVFGCTESLLLAADQQEEYTAFSLLFAGRQLLPFSLRL